MSCFSLPPTGHTARQPQQTEATCCGAITQPGADQATPCLHEGEWGLWELDQWADDACLLRGVWSGLRALAGRRTWTDAAVTVNHMLVWVLVWMCWWVLVWMYIGMGGGGGVCIKWCELTEFSCVTLGCATPLCGCGHWLESWHDLSWQCKGWMKELTRFSAVCVTRQSADCVMWRCAVCVASWCAVCVMWQGAVCVMWQCAICVMWCCAVCVMRQCALCFTWWCAVCVMRQCAVCVMWQCAICVIQWCADCVTWQCAICVTWWCAVCVMWQCAMWWCAFCVRAVCVVWRDDVQSVSWCSMCHVTVCRLCHVMVCSLCHVTVCRLCYVMVCSPFNMIVQSVWCDGVHAVCHMMVCSLCHMTVCSQCHMKRCRVASETGIIKLCFLSKQDRLHSANETSYQAAYQTLCDWTCWPEVCVCVCDLDPAQQVWWVQTWGGGGYGAVQRLWAHGQVPAGGPRHSHRPGAGTPRTTQVSGQWSTGKE